jgi:hypothetical protein
MSKVFVLPRDYKTAKYNPMLYEECSLNKRDFSSANQKLPTMDDAEYASKSIQDASLLDDRMPGPVNISKIMQDTSVSSIKA